ncbi:MAG: methylated-DNA--[protein]-cysteine S-methyltransferase [Actinomyces sp.]|jgi:methylated-DNA--[protein]-cysteine S-methyltransferase|nr:methylated-DNA--[protein]-cysteine S-methyltransferase [Actinomyces sp.]
MRILRIPKNSTLTLCSFDTELGTITCAASDGALSALWMSGQRFFGYPFGISEAEASSSVRLSSPAALHAWTPNGSTVSNQNASVLEQAYQWTQAFLAGTNPDPSTIPLATYGTDFQLRVWNALLDIPYGECVTYADLARKVGSPRAYQAVGSAVGHNPLSLIVPCHRVASASGQVHYGGGPARKLYLLSVESKGSLH